MPLTNNPVLPVPDIETIEEDKRLWIGNLDTRITEFQLLKIVQKYGSIEKFDLMYHKNGPQAGQSRGFAFVTFAEHSSAELMMKDMNGKKVGGKVVVIKLAHTMSKEVDINKTEITIPALGQKEKKDKKNLSRISQIHAIESKLKMMEELPSEDFQISNVPSTSGCLMNFYNQTKQQKSSTQKIRTKSNSKYDIRHKPYFRK